MTIITRPAILDGIALSVPENSFMAGAGYYSPDFFELEMRRILPRCWVFVGDLDQLREPGDYLTETVGYEPVVVVRDREGQLRAFSNVCPHRASLLVEGSGNCGRTIVCPYHGWTFQTDGRLTGIPYRQDFGADVDPAQFGLRPVRVDTWEKFVFVNVTGDAPRLLEWLEDVPELLGNHGLERVRRIHELDDLIEANWKVFMDNAFCDYHVPFVHRRLMPMISAVERFQERAGRHTTVLHTPLSDYGKSISPPWSALVRGARENTFAIGVFPNLLMIAFVTGDLHVLRWQPLAIDRTRARVAAYSHTLPDPSDFRYGRESIERLQREDYDVVEKVQRGLRSRHYAVGPRHYLELRILGFQRRLMEMLAEELAPDGSGEPDGAVPTGGRGATASGTAASATPWHGGR